MTASAHPVGESRGISLSRPGGGRRRDGVPQYRYEAEVSNYKVVSDFQVHAYQREP
jgi:hypothetical protein